MPWFLLAIVAGVFAVRFAERADLFTGLWLNDYRLYMQATQAWLAGGAFYPADQLGGPWVVHWQSILYPPVLLFWFIPFAVAPQPFGTVVWLAIPPFITYAMIRWWRP